MPQDAGIQAGIEVQEQPSRIYGHTLADLIAVVSISSLGEVDDLRRFDVAAELLRRVPESVDLRTEDEGPRIGMWSVSQPQAIRIVRRSAEPVLARREGLEPPTLRFEERARRWNPPGSKAWTTVRISGRRYTAPLTTGWGTRVMVLSGRGGTTWIASTTTVASSTASSAS